MKSKVVAVLYLIAAIILAACGGSADMTSEDFLASESAVFRAESGEAAPFIDGDAAANAIELTQFQDRLIVRTGNISLVVEDTDQMMRLIGRLAEARGGWIVNSSVYESGSAKRGFISIRIPAAEFEATLAEIKEAALEVPSEVTDSQDVTEEYVDLESRLTNLESTAERVRNFLDEARNVEEALAVNQELSRLESEIEIIKGRMQYLSQSAAFSTIDIEIIPDELNQPIEVGGWRPEGTARTAIEALLSALQGIATAFIWGVIFCLPLVILIGIPAFFIIRFVYRRWKRRNGLMAEDVEEE